MRKKLVYLILTLSIFITFLASGLLSSVSAFLEPSPAQRSLTGGEINKELNRELYGCDYSPTDYGSIGATMEKFSGALLNGYGYIGNKCIYDNSVSDLTTAQRLELLNEKNGLATGTARVATKVLDQKPYSGVGFVMAEANRLVSPENAYAQEAYFPGSGSNLLRPMQSFWGWATTVAFSFMTLLIIIVGVALIFRARLGGQTVVQLQNAIPGIVLAMILIPLSYPISGLFIDAITLGTNGVHDFLLSEGGPARNVYEEQIQEENSRGLYADDDALSVLNVRNTIGASTFESIEGLVSTIETCGDRNSTDCNGVAVSIGSGFFSLLDSILNIFQSSASRFIAQIVTFLFGLFAFYTGLKILWTLVKQFLTLIFIPVLSPFIFATLAIPGQGNQWVIDFYLKRMANAAIIFIVTYSIFLLAVVVGSPSFSTQMAGVGFAYTPPLLGNLDQVLQGLGNEAEAIQQSGVVLNFILLLAAYGLYFATPGILNKISESLAPKPEQNFLKPVFDELKSTGNMTYNVAGKGGVNLAKEAAGGVAKGFRGTSRWLYGNRRKDPFDKTNAEKGIDARREQIADLQQKAASTRNPLKKAYFNSRAQAVRAGAAATRATIYGGEGGDVVPKEKAGFSIELQYDILDTTGFGKTLTLQDVKSAITGKIVLKADSEEGAPKGIIHLRSKEPSQQVIGYYRLSGGNQVAKLKLAGKAAQIGQQKNGEITIADKNFQGKNKAEFDVQLEFPSNTNPGIWKMDDPKGDNVSIFIGNANSGPRAQKDDTIRVVNQTNNPQAQVQNQVGRMFGP